MPTKTEEIEVPLLEDTEDLVMVDMGRLGIGEDYMQLYRSRGGPAVPRAPIRNRLNFNWLLLPIYEKPHKRRAPCRS